MNATMLAGTAPRARHPDALVERLTLADGREVVVRPMLAIDADAEQAFVRGLSPHSRRMRFHLPIRELSPELLRRLTDVDHVAHVAIVAEAPASGDAAAIVADARYVQEGGETHFAIAVADAWQRVGLGRALMRKLLRHAVRNGIARMVPDMLDGNAAMRRLAASSGGRTIFSPLGLGVTRAHLELVGPSGALLSSPGP